MCIGYQRDASHTRHVTKDRNESTVRAKITQGKYYPKKYYPPKNYPKIKVVLVIGLLFHCTPLFLIRPSFVMDRQADTDDEALLRMRRHGTHGMCLLNGTGFVSVSS